MRPLRILTWHTHGSYLYYLTRAPHEYYVLSKPGRPPGYGGRCGAIPWGEHGNSGYIDINPAALVGHMQELLRNPSLARQLGVNARRRARERFGIDRFCADWDAALAEVTSITAGTRRS